MKLNIDLNQSASDEPPDFCYSIIDELGRIIQVKDFFYKISKNEIGFFSHCNVQRHSKLIAILMFVMHEFTFGYVAHESQGNKIVLHLDNVKDFYGFLKRMPTIENVKVSFI
jgi:hypothetical protein